MRELSIAVLGAGTAGLATALALARSGHRVTLLERDPLESTAPEDAFGWPRRGIPHFLQPHAFLPRGRKEMRTHFPDVYASLLASGAHDVDLRPKLPGALRPEDEELAYVGVRRPVIEWALRRAALAEPGIDVRDTVRVTGLAGGDGRVRGVRLEEGALRADLVVDALGRTSQVPDWLTRIGAAAPRVDRAECGVIYYSRYYQVRPGETLPDGPWIPTPRAMLPYAAFSSFPGDNRTFAAVLAIPPEDAELKMLRHASAYEAAISTMPALHGWTSRADPMTDVLPMGSLQSTFRHYLADGRPVVQGCVPVGDALCHTNPMFALGLSQSIIHAVAIAEALSQHEQADAAIAAYLSAVEVEAMERFTLSCEADQARVRLWRGESVDFAHPDGAYQLFLLAAGGAAAFADPEVFRAVVRRNGFLDRTTVLDENVELQKRIEALFGELIAQPRAAAGPSRDELLGVISAAVPQ